MAQHVITVVVTADDPDFSGAVNDLVDTLAADGYTATEVRVASDEGEQVVPITPPEEPPPDETGGGEPGPFEPTQLPAQEEGTSNA